MAEINPNLLTPRGIALGVFIGIPLAAQEANKQAEAKAEAYVHNQPMPVENRKPQIDSRIPITDKPEDKRKPKMAPVLDARKQLEDYAGILPVVPPVEQNRRINSTPLPTPLKPSAPTPIKR